MTGNKTGHDKLNDSVSRKMVADTEDPSRQMARQVLFAFIGTYKKLNMYTAKHTVFKEALNRLKQVLDDFLNQFGEMRLQIGRDRILYKDDTVYEGSFEPTDLVFILRRDGVLWIEFDKGLALWELQLFFSILHDYCVLEEDAEDDIVSALWGYNLPSITYEAADLELGLDDDIDFSALPCRPQNVDTTEDAPNSAEQPAGAGPAQHDAEHRPDTGYDHDNLFALSQEERERLDQMIAIEEKLDGSDHVVDVLLYIIETHCLPEDVNDLLNYMVEAMQEALLKCRFSYLFQVLTKVNQYLDKLKNTNHWAVSNVEGFFRKLSSKPFLENLLQICSDIEHVPPADLDDLKKFLLFLDPDIITILTSIMLRNPSDRLHQVLAASVVYLARKDFRPFERVLSSADKTMTVRMIYLLRFFKDSHSRQVLARLFTDQSAAVRKQALKTYLQRKDRSLKTMFVLINDVEPDIRKLLLQHLAQTRDRQAEELLLDSLDMIRSSHPEHFIEICRTLGRCASDRAIPCLTKLLFRWPNLGILRHRGSIQYQGAVAALKELNTPKAQSLMQRVGQGFFKNIFRRA